MKVIISLTRNQATTVTNTASAIFFMEKDKANEHSYRCVAFKVEIDHLPCLQRGTVPSPEFEEEPEFGNSRRDSSTPSVSYLTR